MKPKPNYSRLKVLSDSINRTYQEAWEKEEEGGQSKFFFLKADLEMLSVFNQSLRLQVRVLESPSDKVVEAAARSYVHFLSSSTKADSTEAMREALKAALLQVLREIEEENSK